MARRNQAAAEAAQPTPTHKTAPPLVETVQTAEAGQATDEPKASRLPDVREQKQVSLTPDRDGPKLRLLRSDRYNQMQISSDAELPPVARKRLEAADWKDRTEAEGIWTKQLPPRNRLGAEGQESAKPVWPAVIEAERLFEDIANAIRADHKLPPVRLGTAAEAER